MFGENVASSEVLVSSSGTLAKINSSTGAYLSIANNAVRIEIQTSTVSQPQRVATFITKGNLAKRLQMSSELTTPISDILFMGPVDLKLQKSVSIRMKLNQYEAEEADLRPVVYRQTKDKLEAVAVS